MISWVLIYMWSVVYMLETRKEGRKVGEGRGEVGGTGKYVQTQKNKLHGAIVYYGLGPHATF